MHRCASCDDTYPSPFWALTALLLAAFIAACSPTTMASSFNQAEPAPGALDAAANANMLLLMAKETGFAQLERLKNQSLSTRNQDLFGKWQFHFFGELTEFKLNHRPTVNHQTFDMKGLDHSAGLFASHELINNTLRVGGSFAIGRADFDSLSSQLEFDAISSHLGLTINFQKSRYFADAFLQHSVFDFKNPQNSSGPLLPPPERETAGKVLGLSLQNGYDISRDGGRWAYGPYLELSHLKAKVGSFRNSYAETAWHVFKQRTTGQSLEYGIYFKFLNLTQTFSVSGQLGLTREFGFQNSHTSISLNEMDAPTFNAPPPSQSQSSGFNTLLNLTYATSPNSRLSVHYLYSKHDQPIEGLRLNVIYNF